MGHSTHTKFVSIENAATPHEALRAAVSNWYDQEANRHDSARQGRFSSPKMMAPLAASRSISIEEGEFAVYDGQSVVIPVCTDGATVVKTRTVKLTLTREQLIEARRYPYSLLDVARVQHGTDVTDVELVSLPKARKPKATATEGAAKTVYRIVGGNFEQGNRLRDVYDTMAEARAAGIKFMEENPTCAALSVRGDVVRESGPNLLVIERPEPESAVATVKVTTHTPKAGAKQGGWMVAFDYHH